MTKEEFKKELIELTNRTEELTEIQEELEKENPDAAELLKSSFETVFASVVVLELMNMAKRFYGLAPDQTKIN